MNTQIKITEEMGFCLDFLREHGVSDGDIYDKLISSKAKRRKRYRLTPMEDDDFFTELAGKMRELWPIGKKDNKYDWRDSVKNLSARLKWLWAERNLNGFTQDDCLLVCRRYLSENMGSRYMKLLKYFICKQKEMQAVGKDGRIRYAYESEFANMLESLTDAERLAEKQRQEIESLPVDMGGTLI